jgi:hypothetical protein
MTDSSTTVQATANGGTTAETKKEAPAQRVHGMNRLREDECYFLTRLVMECLDETEHLVRKVNNKAQSRTCDYDGSKGTKPLNREELAAILHEAYECGTKALNYLHNAALRLADEIEPPF